VDVESSIYTYRLADEAVRQALVIDPVFERFDRDCALIRELGLTLRYTLETHVHADHVTGAWRLKEALGAEIVVARRAGATGADRYVDDGDTIPVGDVTLDVRATPGHTRASTTSLTPPPAMPF